MEVLHRGVDRFRRNAGDLADHQVDALFLDLRFRDPDIGNGKSIESIFALPGIAAAGRWLASGHDHFNIGLAQSRQTNALAQDLGQLVTVMRAGHAQPLDAAIEPVEMGAEAKEPAMPDADDIVGHVGFHHAPVGDRDLGIRDRHISGHR